MQRSARSVRRAAGVLAVAGALVLAGCEGSGGGGDRAGGTGSGADDGRGGQDAAGDDPAAQALTPTTAAPDGTAVLPGGSAGERALEVSARLFEAAPLVVVATEQEQLEGASAAASLGVPVLLDGEGVGEELDRLGAQVVLAVGPVHDLEGVDVVAPADDAALADVLGLGPGPATVDAGEALARLAELSPDAGGLLVTEGSGSSGEDSPGDDAAATSAAPGGEVARADLDALPATEPPTPLDDVVVLTTGEDADLAAVGTARAAGARVVVVPDGDPRSTGESVQELADASPSAVLALGEDFGDDETLAWRARTAATGVELPGGGQLVLPGRTYVALYGSPGTPSLGVLGEQPPEETVARAEELAASYDGLTEEPVVPTLEIIVTVASADAGPDGNYSTELPVEQVRPLVELAGEHGLYVVLDLQPGRTDFLTQARMYEELLRLPHVGLALDPEWRLRPDQVHLTQIGQVDVAEVDEVVTYLADLVREEDLPQKVLVLHQFQPRMIPDVDAVDQSRSEVAVLIHADGQGAQPDKQATWRALHAHAPQVEHWGWKNFYDEDVPGPLSPEETMTLVDPVPDFISYQ